MNVFAIVLFMFINLMCTGQRLSVRLVRTKGNLLITTVPGYKIVLDVIVSQTGGNSILTSLIVDIGSFYSWLATSKTYYAYQCLEFDIEDSPLPDWTQTFLRSPPYFLSIGAMKQSIERSYGRNGITINFDIYNEPIKLGFETGTTVDVELGLATKIKHCDMPPLQAPGLLGLRLPFEEQEAETSFLLQRKSQTRVKFSINICFVHGTPQESYINFGKSALPEELNSERVVILPSLRFAWIVKIDSVSIEFPGLTPYTVDHAALDTGAEVFYFPMKIAKHLISIAIGVQRNVLEEVIFGSKPFDCDRINEYLLSYLPTIRFSFQNNVISITPEYLYVRGLTDPMVPRADKQCYVLIEKTKEFYGEGVLIEWVLGLPFFSAVFTEFSFDTEGKENPTVLLAPKI